MFKKFILATVILTIASPLAFAEEKKKVPPKPKIETTKTLDDSEQLLNFEIQTATSDQQRAGTKDKLGNMEIQGLMQQ